MGDRRAIVGIREREVPANSFLGECGADRDGALIRYTRDRDVPPTRVTKPSTGGIEREIQEESRRSDANCGRVGGRRIDRLSAGPIAIHDSSTSALEVCGRVRVRYSEESVKHLVPNYGCGSGHMFRQDNSILSAIVSAAEVALVCWKGADAWDEIPLNVVERP